MNFKKFYNVFNYASLAVLFVLLLLLYTKVFAGGSFVYIVGVTIFLLVLRIIFSSYLFYLSKQKSSKGG